MTKQKMKLKLPLIDADDKHNKFFPSFSFFIDEFKPRKCIIDIFSDHYSFHACILNIKKHMKNLEETTIRASTDLFSSIVVSDTSIKNQVTTSISHIHSFNKPIVKTLHRATNVTTAEAELFTIRCGINQAVTDSSVKHIVVITDSFYIARKIFNSSTHLYQIHSVAISSDLREFFSKDTLNHIEF